jgi:hypothetical protein
MAARVGRQTAPESWADEAAVALPLQLPRHRALPLALTSPLSLCSSRLHGAWCWPRAAGPATAHQPAHDTLALTLTARSKRRRKRTRVAAPRTCRTDAARSSSSSASASASALAVLAPDGAGAGCGTAPPRSCSFARENSSSDNKPSALSFDSRSSRSTRSPSAPIAVLQTTAPRPGSSERASTSSSAREPASKQQGSVQQPQQEWSGAGAPQTTGLYTSTLGGHCQAVRRRLQQRASERTYSGSVQCDLIGPRAIFGFE